MQFRKGTSLLLAVLVLFSNLGLAFNVHYCHDVVSSISLNYQFEPIRVQSSAACCSAVETSKSCCSDKIIKAERKSENILVKSFQIDFQNFILVSNNTPRIFTHKSILKNNRAYYYCDANAPPFYKLYCQLVFYA